MVYGFESCTLIMCIPTVYKTIKTLYTNRGIRGSREGNYTVKCANYHLYTCIALIMLPALRRGDI